MKQTKSNSKLDAKYYKNIFKVSNINGNIITVESEIGNKYTRHSSFFRVVETVTPVHPQNESNENHKQYPKRNRISVQRFKNN